MSTLVELLILLTSNFQIKVDKAFNIRPITKNDAAATLNIYKYYVEKTAVSFEYEPPTAEEWEQRIALVTVEYPWLVCEVEAEIVGYAYGTSHRYRSAYLWSVETAIYLSEKFHGKGIARPLYQALFDILRLQGYVNVYAGVTIPNDKSVAFHKSMGFSDVGTFKKIGFKFGEWHDTRWFQMHLVDHRGKPGRRYTFKEVQEMDEIREVLNKH